MIRQTDQGLRIELQLADKYARPPMGYWCGRPPGGTGPPCEVCDLSTWIELGGGDSDRGCNHPNIDINPGPNVDIVHDLTKGIPLHDSHAERLRTSNFLEHLPYRQVLPLLKECYRVLRSGGSFDIVVPDLDFIIDKIREEGLMAKSVEDPLSWMCCLWGQQLSGEPDFHRGGFTFDYLKSLLEEAGFVMVRHTGYGNPWEFNAKCFKP